MKTDELKTGLWGFKKFSVYQYITALEGQFSARLLEKDREHQAALEQERQRVQQLEEELSDLRRQLEEQHTEQSLIASTLLDAQRYAAQLKRESDAREEEAQQQLTDALELRDQVLSRYDDQLSQLRGQFAAMLQDMDAAARQVAQEVEEIKAAGSDRNMSLFRRNRELAAR